MMPGNDLGQFGLDVSRETNDRIAALLSLLAKWNPAINLVSKSTIPQSWERHVVDSAQIFPLGQSAACWVDLGTGGGFPGLVIAILAADLAPSMRVVLVESDQRKAAFLRNAVQALGVSAEVVAERIETLAPQNANVVSARALAPLSDLCGFAHRHLAPGGTAVFLKGKSAADEVEKARENWQFVLETHASLTDPSAQVLVLKGISHV